MCECLFFNSATASSLVQSAIIIHMTTRGRCQGNTNTGTFLVKVRRLCMFLTLYDLYHLTLSGLTRDGMLVFKNNE